MKRRLLFIVLLVVSISFLQHAPVDARNLSSPVVVKLATIAPNGSPWHETLKDMGEQWQQISNGQVVLRIYPGGVAGGERDVIRRIRIGQLHASLITNNGLSSIAPEVSALVIPLLTDSRESLDRVFAALTPRLDVLLEEKGFIVLNWGDAGWVRFFVSTPDPSIEAVQKAKLFVWSGDDTTVEVWKKSGFNAIPLSATDILPSLQTGMINAYNATAIVALSSQWFAFTPVMIDLPWAPLIGATIISKRTWQKIPVSIRPQLKAAAKDIGIRLRNEVHQMEQEAILEMQKRGLTVIKPDDGQLKRWHEAIRASYPHLKNKVVPAKWFDAAQQAVLKAREKDHGN
ncbi:MAG: TRAP transporter substrate-binding protein DctP [Deltaproteobacteria bacterium]|nr:TRAP transporter substrate-binding protein DctP [Deltaproteobacteria bacterium]